MASSSSLQVAACPQSCRELSYKSLAAAQGSSRVSLVQERGGEAALQVKLRGRETGSCKLTYAAEVGVVWSSAGVVSCAGETSAVSKANGQITRASLSTRTM